MATDSISFESALNNAQARVQAQREDAQEMARSIRPRPRKSIKRFGKNTVTDIDNLTGLMTQMDDIMEAAVAEASADMMEEAVHIWKTNNEGRWSGGEDGHAFFHDGDLIEALTTGAGNSGGRAVGGIGFKDETEENGMSVNEVFERLTQDGVHGPGMKWMRRVQEVGREKYTNTVARRVALEMRKFSGLRF